MKLHLIGLKMIIYNCTEINLENIIEIQKDITASFEYSMTTLNKVSKTRTFVYST